MKSIEGKLKTWIFLQNLDLHIWISLKMRANFWIFVCTLFLKMFGGEEKKICSVNFALKFIAHKIVIQIGLVPHTNPISKERKQIWLCNQQSWYLLFSWGNNFLRFSEKWPLLPNSQLEVYKMRKYKEQQCLTFIAEKVVTFPH